MVLPPIDLSSPVNQLLPIAPFRAHWNFPSKTDASRGSDGVNFVTAPFRNRLSRTAASGKHRSAPT